MKKTATILTVAALAFGLSACQSDDYADRKASVDKKSDPSRNTLEKQNLKRKIEIEERANQIGYVYLVSFAKPMGYYVVKGKVSSSGSQLTPEQDIICRYSGDSCQPVDGPQDDGTYGDGDPGIFFFTSDGVMVHTSLDYVYSTQPLPIEVPLLGGKS